MLNLAEKFKTILTEDHKLKSPVIPQVILSSKAPGTDGALEGSFVGVCPLVNCSIVGLCKSPATMRAGVDVRFS